MSLISYDDWETRTGHFWKSDSYKALSKAFKEWQRDQTQTKLENLAQAFSAWQMSKIGGRLDAGLVTDIVTKSSKTTYILDNHNYASNRNKIKGGATVGPMEQLADLIATTKGSNRGIALQATGTSSDRFNVVKRAQINHSSFTKSMKIRIEEAVRRTRLGLSLVMEDLPKARQGGSSERTVYEVWFGPYDQTRYLKVLKNFQILVDVIEHSNFDFEEDTGPDNKYYAATRPGHRSGTDDIQIYLGTLFFNGGRKYEKSTSATVGTMVHELTHACFYTYDMYLSKDRSSVLDDEHKPSGGWRRWGDLCNDPDTDKELATRFPEKALENADNYGEYAAAVVRIRNK